MIKKAYILLIIGLVNIGSLFAEKYLTIDDDENKEYIYTIGASFNFTPNDNSIDFSFFTIKETGFTEKCNIAFKPLGLILPLVTPNYDSQFSFSWGIGAGAGYSFLHTKRNITTLTAGLEFKFEQEIGVNFSKCSYLITIELSQEIFFGKSNKKGISLAITGYLDMLTLFSSLSLSPRIAYAYRR